MRPSSGSRTAGNEACAQKRASTREVAVISSESRVITWFVNTNTPATSRLAPKNSDAWISSERDSARVAMACRCGSGAAAPGDVDSRRATVYPSGAISSRPSR